MENDERLFRISRNYRKNMKSKIQSAFQYGMIKNGDAWINMMLARNSLSHLYDEEKSRNIYKDIKEIYLELLENLNQKLDEIL